jgi:hypothetical protein
MAAPVVERGGSTARRTVQHYFFIEKGPRQRLIAQIFGPGRRVPAIAQEHAVLPVITTINFTVHNK